jgi:hypothetical protein
MQCHRIAIRLMEGKMPARHHPADGGKNAGSRRARMAKATRALQG